VTIARDVNSSPEIPINEFYCLLQLSFSLIFIFSSSKSGYASRNEVVKFRVKQKETSSSSFDFIPKIHDLNLSLDEMPMNVWGKLSNRPRPSNLRL
jgi:hypothetical protein